MARSSLGKRGNGYFLEQTDTDARCQRMAWLFLVQLLATLPRMKKKLVYVQQLPQYQIKAVPAGQDDF